LIRWGYYQRQGLPQVPKIKIQRVRCTGCGRTTNVLPSFLLAYKYFAVRMAKKLLLLIMEHPHDWKQALKPIIDMSTAYRWLRRFIRQANTSLPAIRKALLELVPDTRLIQPQSLAVMSTPAIVTRFISLSQRLFQASVRLVDIKQPLVSDLFCFINHFLATATGKALLQP
jgi:transposase-like protein